MKLVLLQCNQINLFIMLAYGDKIEIFWNMMILIPLLW